MVKRGTYHVLVFQNLSDYVVNVTFHNYLNGCYANVNDANNFCIKPGDGLKYRVFLMGQRVKIVSSKQCGISQNGRPKFERRLVLKTVLYEDEKFVIMQGGILRRDKVNVKEFAEGCLQRLESQLRIVEFTNVSADPYYVTFHRSMFGKGVPCPRTKALFTVKQGDVFHKIFYNKLYVKVNHQGKQKLAKQITKNSLICINDNNSEDDVSVVQQNDVSVVQQNDDSVVQPNDVSAVQQNDVSVVQQNDV